MSFNSFRCDQQNFQASSEKHCSGLYNLKSTLGMSHKNNGQYRAIQPLVTWVHWKRKWSGVSLKFAIMAKCWNHSQSSQADDQICMLNLPTKQPSPYKMSLEPIKKKLKERSWKVINYTIMHKMKFTEHTSKRVSICVSTLLSLALTTVNKQQPKAITTAVYKVQP